LDQRLMVIGKLQFNHARYSIMSAEEDWNPQIPRLDRHRSTKTNEG